MCGCGLASRKTFFFGKTCVFFDKYVMLRIFIALHIPQFNQHGTSHQNLLYWCNNTCGKIFCL